MTPDGKGDGAMSVNRIDETKSDSRDRKQSTGATGNNREPTCYRCGRFGHFGRDPGCPAKGKTCCKCGLEDHFESQCTTRAKQGEKGQGQTSSHRNRDTKTANTVNSDEEENSVYAFTVDDKKQEKIEVTVGGCKLNMIIDSGASAKIVDKQTWEWLKKNRVECKSARSNKKLYTYASQVPLAIIGTFHCEVSAGCNSVNADFYVISGKGESLLGKDTAMNLRALKMGVYVATVSTNPRNI